MEKNNFTNRTFKNIDYTQTEFIKDDYENCTFLNCKFSSIDLSHITFFDCIFENCDLSVANIENVSFRNVKFKSWKLLGLRFDTCNKFIIKFSFQDCTLNFCSFFNLKIP